MDKVNYLAAAIELSGRGDIELEEAMDKIEKFVGSNKSKLECLTLSLKMSGRGDGIFNRAQKYFDVISKSAAKKNSNLGKSRSKE